MAAKSVPTSKANQSQRGYHLPEEVRKQFVQRPEKSIPAAKLEIVERQRQRFIRQFGSDGLSAEEA